MKLLLFATLCVCAAIAASHDSPKHECPQAEEILIFDPQAVDAAAIDELHDAGQRAICRIGPSALDLVQLCRDKGFDAVSFDGGAETQRLREQAEKLKLPVVDTEGRRTTSGS